MSHATRLTVLTTALLLAASSAQAFTVNGGSNSGTYSGNYGSTLTDPGDQVRNFGNGTMDLSTPGTNSNSGSNSQSGGFSFRYGSGPFGSDTNRRLAPPAWSTDPLYLERDH